MTTPPKKPRQVFQTIAKHADITEKILGAFYHVYGILGSGFLEKVYENALKIELEKRGLKIQQ